VAVNTSAGGAYEIQGTSGDDLVYGTSGNDVLIGGEGNDVLIGGGGADVFQWRLADKGSDTIKDFSQTDSDKLNLGDLLTNAAQGSLDAYFSISDSAGGLVVKYSESGHVSDATAVTHTITVETLTLADLAGGDLAAQLAKLQGTSGDV